MESMWKKHTQTGQRLYQHLRALTGGALVPKNLMLVFRGPEAAWTLMSGWTRLWAVPGEHLTPLLSLPTVHVKVTLGTGVPRGSGRGASDAGDRPKHQGHHRVM